MVGDGEYSEKPDHDKYVAVVTSIIERLLTLSEATATDTAASQRSAYLLLLLSSLQKSGKEPLRLDLFKRAYALEGRTLQNMNLLLNDHVAQLAVFNLLHKQFPESNQR